MQVSRIALSNISNSRKQSISNRVDQQSQNQPSFSAYKHEFSTMSDWFVDKIRPLADLSDAKFNEFMENEVKLYRQELQRGIKGFFLPEETLDAITFTRVYDYLNARSGIKDSQLEHIAPQSFEKPVGKYSSFQNKEAFEYDLDTTPAKSESDLEWEVRMRDNYL